MLVASAARDSRRFSAYWSIGTRVLCDHDTRQGNGAGTALLDDSEIDGTLVVGAWKVLGFCHVTTRTCFLGMDIGLDNPSFRWGRNSTWPRQDTVQFGLVGTCFPAGYVRCP